MSDYEIFLGYALNSVAYRVYNLKSSTIIELINVLVDDLNINVVQEFGDSEVFEKSDVDETTKENIAVENTVEEVQADPIKEPQGWAKT